MGSTLVQHVARAIREEAHVRRWNTSELARRAGLTQTTARHYFYAEDRDAKVEALAAVAAAFDLPISELILRAERAMTAAERIEAGGGRCLRSGRGDGHPPRRRRCGCASCSVS